MVAIFSKKLFTKVLSKTALRVGVCFYTFPYVKKASENPTGRGKIVRVRHHATHTDVLSQLYREYILIHAVEI